jgi:REP element-mobilizing transposase RayT
MGSSYYQLFYHFVWTTYKRNQWIDERIEDILERLILEKLTATKSELLAFGCTKDHVHLLVKLHPSISVAMIGGEVKGYTSYVISNQIRIDLGFRWQRGYAAFSVSNWDLPKFLKYIKNQ